MLTYLIPVDENALDDKFIIYRPLLGLAFVGNRGMADLAKACSRPDFSVREREPHLAKAYHFLESIGFLLPDPPAPAMPDEEFSPTMAVLLLTNQCQLRCRYCYAVAGEKPPRQMSPDIAQIAIDYVSNIALQRNRSHFEVSFHGGGEPTLVWKTLKEISAYAHSRPVPAKISLTSNGVWSRELCEWIVNNIEGLTISIDGAPDAQNRLRPFASGKGSFDRVMRSISELDRRSYPYGIRMTAVEPWDELPRNVEFLCDETGCQAIQVEPTFNTMRGGHGEASEQDGLNFAKAFIEAWEIAERKGRPFFYSGARPGVQIGTFCSAPFQSLIVTTDGTLVTCYEITDASHPLYQISKIGQIDGGTKRVIYNGKAHRRLLDMIRERRDNCKTCFCYWSCAGDCYARAFAKEQHLLQGPRCVLNRYLTKQMLLLLIAKHGGVWRKEARLSKFTPDQGKP